jgi:cytochrome c peroxidase
MKKTILFLLGFICLCTIVIIPACKKSSSNDTQNPPDVIIGNLTLPGKPYDYATQNYPAYISAIKLLSPDFDNTPANNPITNDGATLGRVLFYDVNLSVNNTISCASCHKQSMGFTDGDAFSKGFAGGLTTRNSMSLTNLRFYAPKKMFWDFRANNLEEQVLMPIQNHVEMGITDLNALTQKLSKIAYYPTLFKAAFGSETITSDRMALALAQFLRSIVSFNSRYDESQAKNFSDFTQSEKNGKALYARTCAECHSGYGTFNDKPNDPFLGISVPSQDKDKGTGFGNNGLDLVYADKGIGAIDPALAGQTFFKVPTLRNIALTAPYMHDGRFKSLEEVLDFYSDGVKNNPDKGIQIPSGGFHFSAQEKADIVAFLKTLTDTKLAGDIKYANPFH